MTTPFLDVRSPPAPKGGSPVSPAKKKGGVKPRLGPKVLGILVPYEFRPVSLAAGLSYADAKQLQLENVWNNLGLVSVGQALTVWLSTLKPATRRTYTFGSRVLIRLGFITPDLSLKAFSLSNHEDTIDRIKLNDDWAEATRQNRAALFVSFTGFLQRRTKGVIRKAVPNKEGTGKTFSKIRDKCTTRAMSQAQWTVFLASFSFPRDSLIAKVVLGGGKRIGEVLGLSWDKVDFDEKVIHFAVSKSRVEKEVVITYPQHLFDHLSLLTSPRDGLVFVTRTGRKISHKHIYSSFVRAGKKAKIPFRVTPHVLRASCVTYLVSNGYSSEQIKLVTGHSTADGVLYYDKRSAADNLTKKISLV